MKEYEVVFYEKEDGTHPALDYIASLSLKMRMPYSEFLKDGIFQIRAQQEGNISRVLYFFAVGKRIVLTNGFTKKTPKTPLGEIELAKEYRADYERREALK